MTVHQSLFLCEERKHDAFTASDETFTEVQILSTRKTESFIIFNKVLNSYLPSNVSDSFLEKSGQIDLEHLCRKKHGV